MFAFVRAFRGVSSLHVLYRVAPASLLLLLAAVLAACGGGGAGGSVGIPDLVATVPSITQAPTSLSVAAGAPVTISVVASGSAPLTYQWERNGTRIAGATAATYVIAAATAGDDAAQFRVVVSNGAGSVTSPAATLTVTSPATSPVIVAQPAGVTVTAGATAEFSVTVTGTAPLAFQWQRAGQPIAGATGRTYTTPTLALSDSGVAYSVVVSNMAGSVASGNAVLTVNTSVGGPSVAAPLRDVMNLNDTGVQFGARSASFNNTSCTGISIESQDCSVGRDTLPTRFVFGPDFGSAGFSFSKVDAAGNTIPSFPQNVASCIFDNVTQLLWDVQVGTSLYNIGDGRAGDVAVYVAQANRERRCGRADWRLPTPTELLSLVHYGVAQPDIFQSVALIDAEVFPGTPPVRFWTGQRSDRFSNSAFAIDFATGTMRDDEPLFFSRYAVRLVSAPLPRTTGRWTAQSGPNATEVTDNLHKLIWQRCPLGQTFTGSGCSGTATLFDWPEALRQVSATGRWRLPNIKELASRASPRIDPDAFPGAVELSVWSSTPMLNLTFESFIGGSTSGIVFYGGDRTARHAVWLVRDE